MPSDDLSLPRPLLNTKAAAAFIGVHFKTLLRWRLLRIGPPWVAISPTCVRYRRAALESWLDRRTRGKEVENLKNCTVDAALTPAANKRVLDAAKEPAAQKHSPIIATIYVRESGAQCNIAGDSEREGLANEALIALIEPQVAEIGRLTKAAIRWREADRGIAS